MAALNASRSKSSTITWASNYWWLESQHERPSGQRHTVGLHVSAPTNCVFSWPEKRLKYRAGRTSMCCFHLSYYASEPAVREHLGLFIRSASAYSADGVELTGPCCVSWPAHTSKHSTPLKWFALTHRLRGCGNNHNSLPRSLFPVWGVLDLMRTSDWFHVFMHIFNLWIDIALPASSSAEDKAFIPRYYTLSQVSERAENKGEAVAVSYMNRGERGR